jgi:RES domain-containing protein
VILWRISDDDSLSRIGGTMASGRWHRRGPMILYTAQSASLAMLEVLAGLESDIVPVTYQLLQIEAPDALAVEEFDGQAPTLRQSQDWGMAWIEKGETPLARVPSAIVPAERNMLINTAHPDAGKISIVAASRYPWDHRLFR